MVRDRLKAGVAALAVVSLCSGAADAAVPEFDTREGDLACVGLVNLAFLGATASKPPVPEVVTAMGVAMGFYMGRLSKVAPEASLADVDETLLGLTIEEKNTYGTLCLKRAGELMRSVAR